MKRILTFCLLALTMAFGAPAGAQDRTAPLEPAVREQVYQLLTWQCGVAEVADQFRQAVAALGPRVEPLLLSVLEDGAPAETRRATEAYAAANFERMQEMIAEAREDLSSEQAAQLVRVTRADVVADSLLRLDTLYRENAVRGLGVIGGSDAVGALNAAAARNPDLARLAEQAIGDIRRRQ